MSDNVDYKKVVIGGLGVLGISSIAYYIYNKLQGNDDTESNNDSTTINRTLKKIKDQNHEDTHLTSQDEIRKREAEQREAYLRDKELGIKIFSECLKKVVNYSFEQLYIFTDLISENYDKEGRFIGENKTLDRELGQLQNELLNKLQIENTKIIMAFGMKPETYNKMLQEMCAMNKYLYINYSLEKIEKIKMSFLQNKKPLDYKFPTGIGENYIKIISNLFYLTLKRSSIEVKKIMVDNKTKNKENTDTLKVVRDTYMKHLDEVREIVNQFFQIEDDSLISGRTLLRVYTHSLPQNDVIRKKYAELNKILDDVESNMTQLVFPEEFLIEEENNIPLNEERDLSSLLRNTVDFKLIE